MMKERRVFRMRLNGLRNNIYVAAHAVVCEVDHWEGDIPGFEAALPDTVTFKITYPYSGDPAYFPHTYITGLDGVSDVFSWCVDLDHVIYQNTIYTADIYSSTEGLPYGLVEFPENLDLVNWILNQDYVGTPYRAVAVVIHMVTFSERFGH